MNNNALKVGLKLKLDIVLDLEQDGRSTRVVDEFEILRTPEAGLRLCLCHLRDHCCNLLVPTSELKKELMRKTLASPLVSFD